VEHSGEADRRVVEGYEPDAEDLKYGNVEDEVGFVERYNTPSSVSIRLSCTFSLLLRW
jgi:hypothetical protein